MAALTLEELLLAHSEESETDWILEALGLKESGADQVSAGLSLEGFTTLEPCGFLAQLRNKLTRLPIGAPKLRNEREWAWWERRSRQECRLNLARYLFRPEEVVARALSQMDISEGTLDGTIGVPPVLDPRPYEAEILALLANRGQVYWVSERTSSAINSLVEYPLGSIVLTIKPPGSDLEIELKRAGMRGRLLGVLCSRNGELLSIPHRLQGGSMGSTLQWEARKSRDFAVFYSAATGRSATLSRMVGVSAINTIPAQDGTALILDYFTYPDEYGCEFSAMREEMARCVAESAEPTNAPEGFALTVDFMRAMKPSQGIVAGTSSFRLDLILDYLGTARAQNYCDLCEEDPRALAIDVLEQVLGVFDVPEGEHLTTDAYVEAAFAVPANRARAGRAFLRCMIELGHFLGSLWSLGGYSSGESFAERNIGIARRWEAGEWQTGLALMDHDGMIIPGPDTKKFSAANALPGMKGDERYLFGRLIGHGTIRGSIPALRDIYRVSSAMESEGDKAFHNAAVEASRGMQRALLPGGRLRRYVPATYIRDLSEFRECVHQLGCGRNPKRKLERLIEQDAAFFKRHASIFTDLLEPQTSA